MEPVPRIAFCTTCKGRLQHLKETLPKNIASNIGYRNCVFVVLAYDDSETARYLCTFHATDIARGKLVVYSFRNGDEFHLSHAKNMAARCGIDEGGEILVTLDADNFTGVGFAELVATRFREPGIFLVPDHLTIQSLPHGPLRPCRGFAGRLAVRAADFIKAGGYDEVYNTWRGEDIDMNFRLERIGFTRRFIENGYLNTIPHNADVRFKEYPHARQFENPDEVKVIRARTETVVNFGRFGMGIVRRNSDPFPLKLGPIPTRIFGIGMHKTGTTSLHVALQRLGFDSLHWGTGEAPLIWYEMRALGRSKTLERFYALSDLPIPLLYQELDRAYPGSAFILTVRNEEDWLASVERLWDAKHNKTRYLWDIYPISHTLHTALYGQRNFDAALFLERYRRHNAEVLEYFKGRDDLLVMDMDEGSGWRDLCEFFDLPVPPDAYPQANRSRSIDFVAT